jgi:hypothetical protein
MKNAFEASANSPTRSGLESIKRHIEEAFAKIRQHHEEPPTMNFLACSLYFADGQEDGSKQKARNNHKQAASR